MSKEIGKPKGLSIHPLGVRSAINKGLYAGDGIFHDSVDVEQEESYIDFTQHVKLSTDGMKAEELKQLSGHVEKYSISDLPEEERKKYEKA